LASTIHALSIIEDLLFPVIDRACNIHQRKAIDNLIGSSLMLIELLGQYPLADIKYKSIEQSKTDGVGGGIKKGWVVEVGVTHTISQKNSDNSYSKKIFPNKFLAQRALKKHVKDVERMVQLYMEDEPTDQEWLDSLKLHGKQRESRKGCGRSKN
jgi:hypothetical protein